MYSIGQFSIMFQINKKTLRYYDEIGLFKPAYVNEENQYRYYGENQIAILKEIIRLKKIGIALDEIRTLTSNENPLELKECYQKRLQEIEQEQHQLEQQKQLIQDYNLEIVMPMKKFTLEIKQGYFMEEGNVYSLPVNCELEDIHRFIGLFYEKSKGIPLKGSHIFKMNVTENANSISEIFAYTLDTSKDNIRTQEKEFCFKVSCQDIKQKADGYQLLFDYVEKSHYSIEHIYEQYCMKEGTMQVDILASILQ